MAERKRRLVHLLTFGFPRLGSEPELDQTPNCLGPRRQIMLLPPPFFDGVHL